MRTITIACLLSTLPFWNPPPQVPAEPVPRPTMPATAKKAIEKLRANMQGLWRLTELETPQLGNIPRQEVGYCLVNGNFFSFEMHWGWIGADAKVIDKDFLSGMHRFEFDEAFNMEATTLIGSFFNKVGVLEFEKPGQTRHFKVDCTSEKMILRSELGTIFTFDRMYDVDAPRKDVFGRPVPTKEAPAKETPEKKKEPRKDSDG